MAEDTLDVRRLLELILAQAGAQVETACHGQEALDKAHSQHRAGSPYDLIVMDMKMPVLDGCEAVRQLRARGYRAPIVALTAHAMDQTRDECLAAGFDDYAVKPIDRDTLLAVVGRYATLNTPQAVASVSEAEGTEVSLIGALSEENRQQLFLSFAGALVERAGQIEAAWRDRDLSEVVALAHAVHGSSPLFGLNHVSEQAGQLEIAVRRESGAEEVDRLVQQVARLCREAAEAIRRQRASDA